MRIQSRNNKKRLATGVSLVEAMIALVIIVIVFAAVVPQFFSIRKGWDSREANAEVIQNGRVLAEHLNRNLSSAVNITAVSSDSEPNGYIEFEDNAGSTCRYDVSGGYVRFGMVGSLSELAGPVSELVFTCYKVNDFNTPTTDAASIRMVKVRAVLTNSYSSGQNKTVTASVYLRTNGNNTTYKSFIAYGENNQSVMRCRTWSSSVWSSQSLARDIGAYPRWVVAARCPTRTETAVCTIDSQEDLNVQFFNGSTWSAVTELTDKLGVSDTRCFYAAYEQLSGDLLIAYRYSANDTLSYRTYNGSSFSAESTLSLAGAGKPHWFRLVPKPSSDEILLVALDTKNDVTASVWNGSSWGNTVLLENNVKSSDNEGVWAAYEGISGQAVVVWTVSGTNNFQYRKWTGSAWLTEGNGPTFGSGVSGDLNWVKLAANPSSNEMVAGAIDGYYDVRFVVWNGSSWGTPLLVESDSPDYDRRNFDIAYENGSNRALTVWSRSGNSKCFYRIWDGSSWSAEQSGPTLGGVPSVVQSVTGPAAGQIFVTVLNKSNQIESLLWNGSSFNSPATLVSNAAVTNVVESFMAVRDGGGQEILP